MKLFSSIPQPTFPSLCVSYVSMCVLCVPMYAYIHAFVWCVYMCTRARAYMQDRSGHHMSPLVALHLFWKQGLSLSSGLIDCPGWHVRNPKIVLILGYGFEVP